MAWRQPCSRVARIGRWQPHIGGRQVEAIRVDAVAPMALRCVEEIGRELQVRNGAVISVPLGFRGLCHHPLAMEVGEERRWRFVGKRNVR